MTRGKAGAPPPARRSRRRLPVHFGPEGPEHIGYSGNISSSGMMIRTGRVYAPGTRLQIEIEIQKRVVRLGAVVIWARTGEVQWIAFGRVGMGVRFIDPPADLMERVSLVAAG